MPFGDEQLAHSGLIGALSLQTICLMHLNTNTNESSETEPKQFS